MRTPLTLLCLLLTLLSAPLSGASVGNTVGPVPQEVCVQTLPVHYTQHHCAGLRPEETVEAEVVSLSAHSYPYYDPCAEIETGGPTWTVTLHPTACAGNVLRMVPVWTGTTEVDLRPIGGQANVGSIPPACASLMGLCDHIQLQCTDHCPAVYTCFAAVDVCSDGSYVHAGFDDLAIADVDQDGQYESIGVSHGGGWTVLHLPECSMQLRSGSGPYCRFF